MELDGARAQPSGEGHPRAVAIFGSFRYGQYFEDLLAGVVSAADAAGGSVISFQTSEGVLPSSEESGGQHGVNRAAWDHFDGAIVILKSVSLEYVAALRAAGKFVVAIGQDIRGTHAAITIDNVGGVRDAVTHLADHGHTAIGFLAPDWQVDSVERYVAYCDRLVELGLVPQPRLGHDLSRELTMDEQGYAAAQEFAAARRNGHSCEAVLAGTDLIALGFMRGLKDAGLSVPADVAVVGIDDVDQAAVSDPPLATVAISFERVGEAAFTVASRGATGLPTQSRYVVPQRFVPRDSCGCVSGSESTEVRGIGSPFEAFFGALVEAARESAPAGRVDVARVRGVAHEVAGHLSAPQVGDRTTSVKALAGEVNDLCALDRSVQSAMRAVRTLSQALAERVRDDDPSRVWLLSTATLDLCDAIRSGQLQRRMTEYVDLKRMQTSHYFIGNSLLGHDRDELRSLSWLSQTAAEAGALGLWHPIEQAERLQLKGVYDRRAVAPHPHGDGPLRVESFPPEWLFRDDAGDGRLVVLSQVRFGDSDWGVLAVAGGKVLQSSLVQETFQQWAILMSASMDQERADADLALQAQQLQTAYDTEMSLLEEVRISEERYALAAEATRDALWDWDVASGQVFYSTNWKAMLGHRDHEIGTTADEWLDRVHPEDLPMVREQIDRAQTGAAQFVEFEHRLRVSSGEYRWMECHGRAVAAEDGRPLRLVGSISDVTTRRLLQEELVQEARFDPLTGLVRSSTFKERLNEANERLRNEPERWFAVLFIDLDGFKGVNDTLGHAAGDELLADVARRLQGSLRKNDLAARLGGDEFAVLLQDVDRVDEVPFIVRRLQALVSAPYDVGGRTARVGASIGIAFSAPHLASADALLHEADAAMYLQKHKNRHAGTEGTADD